MPKRTRPTITDVARLAGVSPTTVSYVLSGPSDAASRISDETAARIHEVVTELGYVPNQSARTLRMRRTNRIVFLANRLSSLYSQTMANTFDDALGREGLTVSVQVGSGSDDIGRAISLLDQHLADGLIVETGDTHVPQLKSAAETGHAIVVVGPSQADPACDVVVYEDAPAIAEAMSHLHHRSYAHYLLLSQTPGNEADPRSAAARAALIGLGVPASNISIRTCLHDRVAAFRLAHDLLPTLSASTAVYAGSDVSAIGVLWACLHLGFRVPEDIAILGHGDNPETEITMPPLSSLGPVSRDLSKAADLMISRLRDRSQPGRQIVQPWRLVVRDTT